VKKYFGSQKPFVSNINREGLPGDSVNAIVFLDPLGGLSIKLGKLFGDIGRNVAISLFDGFRCFKGLFGGNADFTLSQQRLDK